MWFDLCVCANFYFTVKFKISACGTNVSSIGIIIVQTQPFSVIYLCIVESQRGLKNDRFYDINPYKVNNMRI